MGVVIAARCNGPGGHCSTVFGVQAMTSSAAHENELKQKLTNLLETIGRSSPYPWASLEHMWREGMNSWVTFFWSIRRTSIV